MVRVFLNLKKVLFKEENPDIAIENKMRRKIVRIKDIVTPNYLSHAVGSKNLTTPTHLMLSPRPTPKRKKWSRTNKESPSGPET